MELWKVVILALLCLSIAVARDVEDLESRAVTIDIYNSSVGKYVTIGDSFSFKVDEEWKTLNITDLHLRNITVTLGPPDVTVNISNGSVASFALGASEPRVSVVLNRTLGDVSQITIMLYDANYVAPKDKVWPNVTVANATGDGTVNATTAVNSSENVSPQSTPETTAVNPPAAPPAAPATSTTTPNATTASTAPEAAPAAAAPSSPTESNVTSTLPPEEKATNATVPSLNVSPPVAEQSSEPDLMTGILVGIAAAIATLLVLFVLGKALKAD